jgi:hypothetical protein
MSTERIAELERTVAAQHAQIERLAAALEVERRRNDARQTNGNGPPSDERVSGRGEGAPDAPDASGANLGAQLGCNHPVHVIRLHRNVDGSAFTVCQWCGAKVVVR